jgi:hypothetical protein
LTLCTVKDSFGIVRITDPMTVRALAHPLRLDLIEVLGTLGPTTAARCGRQLERVWRLSDFEQSWQSGPVTDQLDRVFAQREADRMLGWTARRAAEPAHWQDAAFLGGATLPVTAAELLEIRTRLRAVLDPYVARMTEGAPRPEGARFVRLLVAGTPIGEADGDHGEADAHDGEADADD